MARLLRPADPVTFCSHLPSKMLLSIKPLQLQHAPPAIPFQLDMILRLTACCVNPPRNQPPPYRLPSLSTITYSLLPPLPVCPADLGSISGAIYPGIPLIIACVFSLCVGGLSGGYPGFCARGCAAFSAGISEGGLRAAPVLA